MFNVQCSMIFLTFAPQNNKKHLTNKKMDDYHAENMNL